MFYTGLFFIGYMRNHVLLLALMQLGFIGNNAQATSTPFIIKDSITGGMICTASEVGTIRGLKYSSVITISMEKIIHGQGRIRITVEGVMEIRGRIAIGKSCGAFTIE